MPFFFNKTLNIILSVGKFSAFEYVLS